ncbi:MAG TPA: hypothetical protein ENL04_00690 [Sulfuricurvum sp.]|nr:hypothetical protein [Sulfuricurvum sp.]
MNGIDNKVAVLNRSIWSMEMKNLTRKFVRDRMPAAMKKDDGSRGVMGYREGKIVLFDRDVVGKQYVYDDAEALLDDGWVVD